MQALQKPLSRFSGSPVTGQAVINGSLSNAALSLEQLAATLLNYPQTSLKAAPLKSFAMMGATAGVGTTTVAVNLAHLLSNENVLVVTVLPLGNVDDIRKSTTADMMGTAVQIAGNCYHTELSAARLTRMAAQTPLGDIIHDLEKKFGYVIWDIPPADKLTLSSSVCQSVQGTVLVVQAGKTRWQSAKHTLDSLKFSGINVLGVVLNKKKNYIPASLYRLFFRHDS